MTDILQKIKNWDFTSKDSSITLNLDYVELAEISDVVDRKLWFVGEVTEEIIETIVYNILRYNTQDKDIPVEKRKPILLYISSPGGSVYDGLSLVSAIQTSITPVYTINLGQACSMGSIIFLVGHKRYCMPNSIFLIHEGEEGIWGDSSSKVAETINFHSRSLAKMIEEIILSKTNITKKQYKDKYKTEWYFLSEEAKKLGVVDYIIGKDCDLNSII